MLIPTKVKISIAHYHTCSCLHRNIITKNVMERMVIVQSTKQNARCAAKIL